VNRGSRFSRRSGFPEQQPPLSVVIVPAVESRHHLARKMGCKFECDWLHLCHSGSRCPFWPKHLVQICFMATGFGFRYPLYEKCGLGTLYGETTIPGGGEAPPALPAIGKIPGPTHRGPGAETPQQPGFMYVGAINWSRPNGSARAAWRFHLEAGDTYHRDLYTLHNLGSIYLYGNDSESGAFLSEALSLPNRAGVGDWTWRRCSTTWRATMKTGRYPEAIDYCSALWRLGKAPTHSIPLPSRP